MTVDVLLVGGRSEEVSWLVGGGSVEDGVGVVVVDSSELVVDCSEEVVEVSGKLVLLEVVLGTDEVTVGGLGLVGELRELVGEEEKEEVVVVGEVGEEVVGEVVGEVVEVGRDEVVLVELVDMVSGKTSLARGLSMIILVRARN